MMLQKYIHLFQVLYAFESSRVKAILISSSVAVIAFKACYNMEMARRHNDKRVVTLFKEMRDMIEVLIR